MAEQVVNIRDRIEKMRNQINDKPESEPDSIQNEEVEQKHSVHGKKEESDSNKNSVIESVERFKEEAKNRVVIENNNNEIKPDEAIYKEKINFEKRKTSQKSYKDYQAKNLVDENQEPFVENKSQSFPQFSLNVNNPISWKLMLLIMLMQLLTNIMLVVVLYLK